MQGQEHFCACDLAQALASAAAQAETKVTLCERTQDKTGEAKARAVQDHIRQAQGILGCGSTA